MAINVLDLLSNIQTFISSQLFIAAATAFLTALSSYYATHKLASNSRQTEKKLREIDLIDKLFIEIEKLDPLFNTLTSDFDRDNFFSFKNIEIISNTRWRLITLTNDVILLSDALRRNVLETIESVSLLINEIDSLEKNPVQNYTDLKNKTEAVTKEYRSLTLELLKIGISIDLVKSDPSGDLYLPQYISTKKKVADPSKLDRKLQIVESIKENLSLVIKESQQQLNNVTADSAKRRERFVPRILDLQGKLKALKTELEFAKS